MTARLFLYRGDAPVSMELPSLEVSIEEKEPEPPSPTGSETDFGSLEEQARLFFGRGALERDLPAFRFQLEHAFQHSVSPLEKAKAAKYLAVLCQMEKGEESLQKAREYFEAGFQACQTDEKLTLDFLEFLQRQGEFSRAFEVCSEAIEKNKWLEGLFCIRARIGALLGKYTEALADARHFLDSRSPVFVKKRIDEMEMRDLAADCLIREGRRREAEETLEEAWALEFNAVTRAARARKLLDVRREDRSSFLRELSQDCQRKKVEAAIALSKERRQESLQMVEEAIQYGGLTPFFLVKALALRIAISVANGEMASACRDLEQLAQTVLPSVSERNRSAATQDFCHAEATVYLKQGRGEEALDAFRKGWHQGEKSRSFVLDYLAALKSEKKEEEALKICNEAQELLEGEEALLAQLEVYSAKEEWEQVQKICAECLKKSRNWASQMKICDLAAEACKRMDPPPLIEIYSYLKEAYRLDRTPNFIRRHEELAALHEQLVKTQDSALLALPKKDEKMILEIADELVEKDPRGALEVLEWASENWEILLTRADAHMKLGNLISARGDVEKAWNQIHPQKGWRDWLFGTSSLNVQETRVFGSFAKLCIQEGKPKEARQYFKQGMSTGCPTVGFLKRYLRFLIESEKDFKEASRLIEARELYSEWKIKLDLASQEWDQIIQVMESYRCFRPSLELLDAAVTAYLKKDRYDKALEKAMQAFEKEEDFSQIPARLKRIEEIFWQKTTYKHLEDLLEDVKENESLTTRQKIVYVTELLKIYRGELDIYWSCKARLLQFRGHECVRAERFQEAFEDFSAAYELYKKDPSRWKLPWLKKVIKEAKKRCPKAPCDQTS